MDDLLIILHQSKTIHLLLVRVHFRYANNKDIFSCYLNEIDVYILEMHTSQKEIDQKKVRRVSAKLLDLKFKLLRWP